MLDITMKSDLSTRLTPILCHHMKHNEQRSDDPKIQN